MPDQGDPDENGSDDGPDAGTAEDDGTDATGANGGGGNGGGASGANGGDATGGNGGGAGTGGAGGGTGGGGAARSQLGADEQYCSSCGEPIKKEAEICPHCGVRNKSASSGGGSSTKDRTTAGILAILLGGIGAHKFYLNDTGLGLLYLCFSWTLIPAVIGLIEGIIYLTKTDEEFQRQYVD